MKRKEPELDFGQGQEQMSIKRPRVTFAPFTSLGAPTREEKVARPFQSPRGTVRRRGDELPTPQFLADDIERLMRDMTFREPSGRSIRRKLDPELDPAEYLSCLSRVSTRFPDEFKRIGFRPRFFEDGSFRGFVAPHPLLDGFLRRHSNRDPEEMTPSEKCQEWQTILYRQL